MQTFYLYTYIIDPYHTQKNSKAICGLPKKILLKQETNWPVTCIGARTKNWQIQCVSLMRLRLFKPTHFVVVTSVIGEIGNKNLNQ